MSPNENFLKQAIEDAKSVRQRALDNARTALMGLLETKPVNVIDQTLEAILLSNKLWVETGGIETDDKTEFKKKWEADVSVISKFKEEGVLHQSEEGNTLIPNPIKPDLWPFEFLSAKDFEYVGTSNNGEYDYWTRKETVEDVGNYQLILKKRIDKNEKNEEIPQPTTASPTTKTFSVIVREHDDWSGPSHYTKIFNTREEAQTFVRETNGENSGTETPTFYLTADEPTENSNES